MSSVIRTASLRSRRRLPWPLRRVRRWVFFAIVRSLVAALRRLPRFLGRRILLALAAIAWRCRGREREVAIRQIERAMPAVTPDERRRMARASIDVLAANLLDMVRADVEVEVGPHEARTLERLARAERGVLVLMAHHGAWELVGPTLAERLGRFGALTARAHNEWIGRWLEAERAARGIVSFDRDQSLRPAARWLRDGGALAVLADHRTRGTQVRAKWFGEWAPTMTGPVRLAYAGRVPILPVGIRRTARGHALMVGERFELTGELIDDVQRCNDALEELVLRSPVEWTWIHDRYGRELECGG